MAKIERITIAEAKRQAADWEAEYARSRRTASVSAHYKHISAAEVIRMWESGRNEHGRKINQIEFEAPHRAVG